MIAEAKSGSLIAAAVLVAVAGLAACSRAQGEGAGHAAAVQAGVHETQNPVEILVYKSPTCGCCTLWGEHLQENGFTVVTKEMTDLTALKQELGVPQDLFSCHTAVVEGYAIEGHVPADVIQKLLAERPAVAGLVVPGMPMGSPGMEGPRKDPYEVLTFDREGKTAVYARR